MHSRVNLSQTPASAGEQLANIRYRSILGSTYVTFASNVRLAHQQLFDSEPTLAATQRNKSE
jgi:hypothetical protein